MERTMKRALLFLMSIVGVFFLTLGGYETVKSFSSIQYLDIIRAIKNRRGWNHIPDGLTLATIETESSFDANAYRYEAKINDASYGLMQILFKTAQWMGYKGDPEGLYDPETNIEWATAYHNYLFKRYGDWDAVIHSYNEGPGNYDKGIRVTTYYARVKGRWEKWEILLSAESE
jgi:soluble lytic murein transglycosylase-like protein